MVRKVYLKLTALIFLITYYSCDNIEIKKESLTGKYRASDGAFIELFKDDTFIAKEINLYNIDGDYKGLIIDFEGKWIMENYNGIKRIYLKSDYTYADFGVTNTYIKLGKEYSHNIGFSLDISGQGLLENKPPWDLFVWIGDPDDLNKYKFVKQ